MKRSEKFKCEICDFGSSHRGDFKRHLSTIKHMKRVLVVSMSPSDNVVCSVCERVFKSSSGLWKHRKSCVKTKRETMGYNDVVLENAELKNEMNKMKNSLPVLFNNMRNILKTQNDIITKQNSMVVGNQTNIVYNNKISINVYLNQTCKDAMNLKDFIDNLSVSLEDLKYTKDHGYVKGISNIFVKQLNDMEPTQRPIHCSDDKRLKFYIKDDNKWEKDNNNYKLDRSINNMALKQIKKIKDWEYQHPNYSKSPQLLMEWHSMIKAVMGSEMTGVKPNNNENIKKEIGGSVKLSMNMLNK